MAGVTHLANPLGKTSILSVTIPEIKKRRVPNKFYVYKIIVQWSNGQNVTVYRRYSNFFDFWCKLKELHTSYVQKGIRYADNPVPLPEMPGKIFLGRSQTHQVAQKRQKKLEEFCQQLIKMPSEVSQSTVVYGFFSLWPDDSISAFEVRRNTASGQNVIKPDMTSSVQIPSPSPSQYVHPLLSAQSTSAVGSATLQHGAFEDFGDFALRKPRAETIDITDFMEEEREADPTYRAVSGYSRLDAQQVNLREGQVVRVIEKHDTGWWMVEASCEQGYVPASLLEPLDDTEKKESQEDALAEPDEYVVLEKFDATAIDELNLLPDDVVTTVSIKMDGWWKIKKGTEVGYAPSAILRKKGMAEITKTLTRESQIFLNDVTLLRSSRRFPPRHYSTSSSSRGSVRAQQRKVSTVDEDSSKAVSTKSAVSPYDNPKSSIIGQGLSQVPDYRLESPYDIPRGCKGPDLPPGIERRYEWCNPNPLREALQNHYEMDTEESASDSPDGSAQPEGDSSIYQVPRSVAVNSNLSNNQDHRSGSAESVGGKIDIYSNLEFSPPPGTDAQQVHGERRMDASVATTTTDEPNPKSMRIHTSSSSIAEPISTVDPELLVSLNMEEEISPVPKKQDGADRAVSAEKSGQNPLVPPPRIPRSHTVASPAAQGGVSSGVRKPPPPPPLFRPKLQSLHENPSQQRLANQESDDNPPIKQPNRDSAVPVPSIQNRPLPSAPAVQTSVSQPQSRVLSQSPARSSRPPPPPPYSRKQPVPSSGADTSPVHKATIVGRPLPNPPAPPTPMKGRPLPRLPHRDRSETDVMGARPLPVMARSRQPVNPALPPPRVPRAEGSIRDRSDTVPANPADCQGEYWKMNSALRTLTRQPEATDPVTDNEYIYIDDDSLGLQTAPGSGSESARGAVKSSMQNETSEGPTSPEAKSLPTPQLEENSAPPHTSRVLSTEPLNESAQGLASISEQDCIPSPWTSGMLVSEGAEDFPPHSPVDYLNVTSDMLDEGMSQLYQNVIHPESEYLNYKFVPVPKPAGHLGTFVAVSSADQTDECLRVKANDRGELLAESKEWWYMRIGGEEGWTPKEIWEPTVETRALQHAGLLGAGISKNKSFSAADIVRPKAPPPKPRRVFEHIQETSQEPQEGTRVAPGAGRRQHLLTQSMSAEQPSNSVTSLSNGTTSYRNGSTSPTSPSGRTPITTAASMNQGRPLPEPPAGIQTGQYVCNVSLPLDLQPWFYKAMDRPEAEKLLRMGHVRNREFLVRERPKKPGYYALSVRHHYSIRHFNIDPISDGGPYSIGQRTFNSLPDIILHYQTHSLFMEGSGSNQSPVTIVRPAKLLRMVERQRSNTSLQ